MARAWTKFAATVAVATTAGCCDGIVRNDAHVVWRPSAIGEDRFALVGGFNVHYVDAGSGPPIVLIPGAFSTYRAWSRVLPTLVQQHRVIAIDYLGTGDSDKPEEGFGYSVEEQADVVAALLEPLHLSQPVVAGVSYGRSIALAIAARHPALPAKVVCLEGGARVAPDVLNYSSINGVFGNAFFGTGVLGVLRSGFLGRTMASRIMGDAWDGLTDDARDEIVAIQASFLDTTTRRAIYAIYRAITGDIDFTGDLANVRAPVLYLYGASSKYRAVAEANVALFRERLRNVETIRVRDGIHDLQLQFPRAIAAILADDGALDATSTLFRGASEIAVFDDLPEIVPIVSATGSTFASPSLEDERLSERGLRSTRSGVVGGRRDRSRTDGALRAGRCR